MRLREETYVKPKPMVDIGEHPILWHIMHIYSAGQHKEFVVALGYKGNIVKNYFLNYRHFQNDFRIRLDTGKTEMDAGPFEDWLIHLIDTGPSTETGGRVKRLAGLIGGERFMMTYGDAVADIDVRKLVEFHKRHGKLATVTAVRPPARFGGMRFDGDLVTQFLEKPQIGEGWINGGFFVLEPKVFDYIDGDETVFERGPLERLARDGQLAAYRHEGFWQCMDTMRELRMLESLWKEGKAPWKIW